MNRQEFERACREQNEARARQVAEAREQRKPCDVVTMFAFGGVKYCAAHNVMGPCPYGPLERCECGAPGLHPYPIGGGWALSCDDCKAAAIMDAAVGMPDEGADAAQWDEWHAAAFGTCPRCGGPVLPVALTDAIGCGACRETWPKVQP